MSVSIGVKVIRNAADDRLAATVLIRTGQVREERRARIPALAAVSPNLDRGAWNLVVSSSGEAVLAKTHKAAPRPA